MMFKIFLKMGTHQELCKKLLQRLRWHDFNTTAILLASTPNKYAVSCHGNENMTEVPSHPQYTQGPVLEWMNQLSTSVDREGFSCVGPSTNVNLALTFVAWMVYVSSHIVKSCQWLLVRVQAWAAVSVLIRLCSRDRVCSRDSWWTAVLSY